MACGGIALCGAAFALFINGIPEILVFSRFVFTRHSHPHITGRASYSGKNSAGFNHRFLWHPCRISEYRSTVPMVVIITSLITFAIENL
jgi:hypothetical protein